VLGTPAVAATVTAAAAGMPPGGTSARPAPRLDFTFTLQNPTGQPVDMRGWRLRVGDQVVALPADAIIPSGQLAQVHPYPGETTGNDVYVGAVGPEVIAALRPGARVVLEDRQGRTAAQVVLPA
jgi:hypothetical protein